MNKADFDYDHGKFRNELSKATFAFKRIKDQLNKNFDHWVELGPKFLDGNIAITVNQDRDGVTGFVAGKKFSLSLMPLAIEGENYGLVAVSITDPVTKNALEVERFLVSIHGDVLSTDKEVLLSWEDDFQSLKLLIAITRSVLHAWPKE